MLRHAPDHHMRPASTSASVCRINSTRHAKRTPFSLHVTSRQHIHLQTTARKDKLARRHDYHLWSAWQRSPSTSPPASLEFMSPCREYSSVLFGSIIPPPAAQPSPAQPSPAQPSPAQPAQPSPAQPSPAQPSQAQQPAPKCNSKRKFFGQNVSVKTFGQNLLAAKPLTISINPEP